MQTHQLRMMLAGTLFLVGSAADAEPAPRPAPQASTCPAQGTRKGGPLASMPADAKAVMDRFVTAVVQNNPDKALSCCTVRTRSRAGQYDREDYFQRFVPIAKLQGESAYRFWTYSGDRVSGEYTSFGCFLDLSKTAEGGRVSWHWWLEKTADGWRIDLPDVPIDRWIQEETDRLRRLQDKREAQWRALEPKLEGLRTQLSGLQREYRIGAPITYRRELVNAGGHELTYDRQQVAVNGSMTITNDQGERVRATAPPVQTGGSYRPIRPGQTISLFDSLDIARQYDLSKPGHYRVQFNGGGLRVSDADSRSTARRGFPSNTVEIEVKP